MLLPALSLSTTNTPTPARLRTSQPGGSAVGLLFPAFVKKTGRGVIGKFHSPISFFSSVRASGHAWLIYILTLRDACSTNACWVIETTVFRIFPLPVITRSVINSGIPEGYTALASTCWGFPRVFRSHFGFVYTGCLFRLLDMVMCWVVPSGAQEEPLWIENDGNIVIGKKLCILLQVHH